jgi:hypothetical protein
MYCTILCVRPQVCRDDPPINHYFDTLVLLFILKKIWTTCFNIGIPKIITSPYQNNCPQNEEGGSCRMLGSKGHFCCRVWVIGRQQVANSLITRHASYNQSLAYPILGWHLAKTIIWQGSHVRYKRKEAQKATHFR